MVNLRFYILLNNCPDFRRGFFIYFLFDNFLLLCIFVE
nr:MAG TPA: hypothetical protein [Caudoviricetes sp.]